MPSFFQHQLFRTQWKDVLVMLKLLSSCAMAAALCAAVIQPVSAKVDGPIKQALALHASGKAQQAYEMLLPLMARRAGDSDYDYALGIAAADSGRPAEAIIAFQRVLAAQPNNAKARAELARAYALAGDIDTARAQFDTVVQDPSLPDPVRQRFDRLVREYDSQINGSDMSLSGFADAAIGYDSNINAATDDTNVTIPLFEAFGPGTLGANARETDAGFYQLSGGASLVKGISRQTRLFGSVLGTWRDNIQSDPFDQASLTGTAGISHTLADRNTLSVSIQAQQFWLGQESFRQSYGMIGQYTRRLNGGKALSVSGEYFRLNNDFDALRDASRYAGGISYAGRNLIVSITAGHEETRQQAGDHLSFDFYRANVGYEKPLAKTLSVVAGLNGQIRRHDAADPLFLVERADEQIDASLGLRWLVAPRIIVRPRVGYTRNYSNIALNDYDRLTASLGMRIEF